MKRTGIRRRTAPKVRTNADGKPRERFEGLRLEDFRDWIRARPCLLHGPHCRYANHESDAAHVENKSRGAGDAGNLVPLCRGHHREQHGYGQRSFEREHGVRLKEIAGALWLEYEKQEGAPKL